MDNYEDIIDLDYAASKSAKYPRMSIITPEIIGTTRESSKTIFLCVLPVWNFTVFYRWFTKS